jgi:hypothetical protein
MVEEAQVGVLIMTPTRPKGSGSELSAVDNRDIPISYALYVIAVIVIMGSLLVGSHRRGFPLDALTLSVIPRLI